MQEVFEKIIAQFTSIRRVIKNDEDLEWNRAVYKCTEIVRQAAEYNNGWIPCHERLPEKKGKYLTTSKIYFVPDHVDEPDNYIGLEITYYSEINGWSGDVIAWQPLPDTYQLNGECPKKTNFDLCCESMEAMAQIIEIAKIGWTKDQIMEWLQKGECLVPE